MKINWINISVKLFAIVFLVVAFSLNAAGVIQTSMSDAIAVAVAMVGVFLPVDASKLARAIKGDQ